MMTYFQWLAATIQSMMTYIPTTPTRDHVALESTIPTMTTEFKLHCKRCDQDIAPDQFHEKYTNCAKSRCYIRRPIAREILADKLDKHPDDFIPVVSGAVHVWPEKAYEPINEFGPHRGHQGNYCGWE